MPFRSLGLDPAILKAVGETGYTEPTPIQSAAIPVILSGRDLIGIAQTGTGKTAAFTLPILSLIAKTPGQGGVRTLIVAPTRELVVQIEENVRAYARHLPVTVATIFGGVGERPQIKALEQGADIVIATPGRLLDLINGREKAFSGLEFLVLDEADRMLDMGFIPAIRRIVRLLPAKRQTLFFSATLSKDIERLTGEFLRNPETVEIGRRSNPADTVAQSVHEVPQYLKADLLLHLLADRRLSSVLVFSRTKHGADKIARKLDQAGISSATIHSNRSQNQRLRALHEFRDGKVRVLVATDIAARGIDVDGITHVINYDFPANHEDYVHRIGRTGRAKSVGEAVSFVSRDEEETLRDLERRTRRGVPRVKAEGFDYAKPQGPREGGRDRRPARKPGEVRGGGGGAPARGPRRRGHSKPKDVSMSGEASPAGGKKGLGRLFRFGKRK